MLKMEDVAKLANVSTATVSRVLSNNKNVSKKTRKKVLEVIKEVEYKPNRLAANLRKNSSETVAVILPDITNPFFAEIVKGFRDEALKNGYHILLCDTGNCVSQEEEFAKLVKERLVDGIILATARMPKNEIYKLSQEIPVVLACEYVEDYQIPTVSIDNVSAAREATEYLIEQGHERIGLITGPLEVILSRDRVKGYRQALLLRDLPVTDFFIQEGDYSVKSGFDIMMKFLAHEQKPTAVFASSDEMAVGALKACKSKGLRIPEDISIIGFDDVPLCTLVEPELTTVSQPKYELGSQAMKMLLTIIETNNLSQKQIVLPHKLMVRQTTREKEVAGWKKSK
ncbi:LacI family DNA-binding transcriptional regulator [Aneurinibacillus sp. Ricciae_BoGa-3]|uniref:LacI family DNA-binding transcriptional regulator n=1 Tax=Aneurinibacillus sp. Ricciae_BoGa-3 TaxID=3022697 RepID=UPI002341CDB5|nr:LacI family DNA-binding transcriptional regulator [Aneurinibacillus sp. Ricciae_BoGa-3]WCK53194.1 LacI family DNA-binding transcriptional regulator [Aneurinibacillus sp. Ricciae_BoGa-3]